MALRKLCKYRVPFMGGSDYNSESATYGLLADTSVVASGSSPGPSALEVSGGGVALSMSPLPNNTVAVLNLFNGDVLPFPLANIERVWFELKASGLTASTTVLCGVCGTSNDILADITTAAWLKASGGSSIVAETRDGQNNSGDVSTGLSLSSKFKLFAIDLANGLPDVRFFGEDSAHLRRCGTLSNTTFSIVNAQTQNVQFIARVEKNNSSDAPILYVRNLLIEYRSN